GLVSERTQLIDVTRALRTGHPNWPGDVPLELSASARIAEGASVNLGSLRTSLHAGTHVDAPWHYDDAGVRLGGLDLSRWVGEALVLDVAGAEAPVGTGASVGAEALARTVAAVAGPATGPLPPRWLLRTGQPDDWGTTFPTDFRALTPESVAWAAERGVVLLGTDAPSIDPLTSTDLPAHGACARHDVAILEGLALAAVAPGRYELLCLPLSLPEADGAPARAVLRTLP
ncbi:MAG: cyclase family protein, partial [Trueperaceae bacterium]|nr:cyclase family protein [Trueperaceae bacterium]